MKKTIISACAAFAAFAATAGTESVYRLLLRIDDAGNEKTYIVGKDGQEREAVLINPVQFQLLTERFDTVWASLHSTSEGRRKLHGKIARTVIDEKALKKTEVHEDGYVYEETMKPKRPRAEKKTRLAEKIGKEKTANISARQWGMRLELAEARKGKGKTVMLEHDAATGKDTIKEAK